MDYRPATAAVLDYIARQYGAEPEYLWLRSPNCAAIRHGGSKKWFAALMLDMPGEKIGLPAAERADILNVKCDPRLLGSRIDGRHYLPGYHMNKEHWLTIVLDEALAPEEACALVDLSFALTAEKKKR